MRPTNGNSSAQTRRVVYAHNRFVKGHKELQTRNQRFAQTKLKKRKLSPPTDGYDENDIYSDIEDDTAHNETVEPQKAFTVRPLLKLLSDDSDKGKLPAPEVRSVSAQAPATARRPIVYNDISLCSEEEEESPKKEEQIQPTVFKNIRHSSEEEDSELLQDKLQEVHEDAEDIPLNEVETQSRLKHNRFEWTPRSTNLFLDLWQKHLRDIRGSRKNTLTHREMAEEMSEYDVSPKEIRTKMCNMSRKYKQEAEKIKSGIPSHWRYFNRVKSLILGPLMHFEEIIFDNAESSPFFEVDKNCDTASETNHSHNSALRSEDTPPKIVGVNRAGDCKVEENVEPPPVIMPFPDKIELPTQIIPSLSAHTSERMLQIEQAKLEIEKQKLQVMRHISRDLSSISITLNELLRNTKK